jgi:molybdopterin/thiamine biosynthesis adenylyltransferase/rhodanese-related sulfurtransferase
MNELRYVRQIGVLGVDGQQKLVHTKVLCIGAGGLGTLVSSFLVNAGIRHIGLMDKDIIEVNNLNRQLSYTEKDCGQSKVKVLKDYLQERNSNCQINIYDCHLSVTTEKIIDEYDLILDCTDNFPTKYLISDLCCINNKPLISASIDGFQGQVITLMPDMCYRCIFPAAANGTSCNDNDVIGPSVGVIASIQANETIKLITELSSLSQLTQIDTLDNTMSRFEICPDCECINGHEDELHFRYKLNISFINWQDVLKLISNETVNLVDIRKDQTQPLLTHTIKSSYEDISRLQLTKEMSIVIVCNSGQRSKLAALKLAAKNYQRVFYTKF